MQDAPATLFDDGFGFPHYPAFLWKLFYFYYDRMPWGTYGWEAYFDLPAEVPEY